MIRYLGALMWEYLNAIAPWKPIIREERAKISTAALIKLVFPIARGNKSKTQEQIFKEGGFYLNLIKAKKEEVWESIKSIPSPLKMSKKPDLFSIRADLKAIFKKKIRTGFQKLKSGKWRMDLSCNRTRLNFKRWWTKTASPHSFKILSRSSFRKHRASTRSSTPLYSAHE